MVCLDKTTTATTAAAAATVPCPVVMNRPPNNFESIGLAGVTAVMVVNVTHPIDFYKTSRQVDPLFALGKCLRKEGVRAVYKGVQAAWCREAAYTSFKLGAYGPLRDAIGGNDSFVLKLVAGGLTGGFGSVLGNPFDLLKTRLMTTNLASTTGPRGMIGISRELYQHQGVGGFYRGLQANVSRAVALNAVKMSTYDSVKGQIETLTGWKRSDWRCQILSSFFAGFMMAVCITPFDFLRTILMNQPAEKKVYRGIFHAGVTMVQTGGPLALYRGFFMIWARFIPMTTLQLMTYEKLRAFFGFSTL